MNGKENIKEKWYISCTAIWNDADKKDEFKKLESDFEEENKGLIKSENYKELKKINDSSIKGWLVPEERRHSTVLNIREVEVNKKDSNKVEEKLVNILKVLVKDEKFKKSLNGCFKPMEVILYEIWFKPDGIKFQFKETSESFSLETFRVKAKSVIKEKKSELMGNNSDEKEWKLYNDEAKNCGRKLFGSFTRRNVESKTKWVYKLKKEIKIKFNKIYLLVSDSFLFNEAAVNDKKRIIIGKE